MSKPYDLKEEIKNFQQSDIFILPSIREGLPQVLLEAMASGLIVISSATQGGKELVKDGKNGFLFEIGNEKELAEKILYCLKNSKQGIRKIQKLARKKVGEFRWSKLIKKLESCLNS